MSVLAQIYAKQRMARFDKLPSYIREIAWEYHDAPDIARFTIEPSKIIAACEYIRVVAAFKNYGPDHPQARQE